MVVPPPESPPEPTLSPEPIESVPAELIPDTHINVDPQRKEFIFRLSYTGAAVCSFGVMVGLVGAFVLGQRSGVSTVPVLAALSTEQLKALPPQPDVLQLGRPAPADAPAPLLTAGPITPVGDETAAKENRTWTEPKPPQTLVVQDAQRMIGLHYVLVQSYPKEEESMALAACKLLQSRGIECTVEKGVPGWENWNSVMGTRGFDKFRSSPDFEKYLREIMAVSAEFAGSAKFKRFEPIAYKWRGKAAAK